MIFSRTVLAAVSLLLVSSSKALTVPSLRISTSARQNAILSASLSSSSSNVPSDEMIRKDIEAMREEAKQRLQNLNSQMEDMLRKHHLDDVHRHQDDHSSSPPSFLEASAFENVIVHSEVVDHSKTSPNTVISVKNIPKQQATEQQKVTHNVVAQPPSHFADSSLLHDTRWKVVIKVGSTQQNEVLEEIEKPLLVHLVVDFTPEALREGDDLLQGSANAKVLRIKEAWIGASSVQKGRQRDVKIRSTGGWKVLSGQGPKGIDILRFYVDVEEEICHDRDRSILRCPAKRVYCTSGFFSLDYHNESEAFKDYLRGELDSLVHKYEDLTLEDEEDERLFSLEGVKRAKQMMDLRTQIKATNKKITQARIRDPEKSMLRLSRRRDVGVTKEGQVCYRETKGLSTTEYLVLGKMEMASIDKPIIENQASSELRP